MKKFSLAVAIVVMGLAMASCGNKEKELMQKATEFYTQNETELKAVDNVEGFAAFCQNFKQKLNDFKATYSDMKLSQETYNFLADQEKAFNELESQKFGELFTPGLEQLENANKMLAKSAELQNLHRKVRTAPELNEAYSNFNHFCDSIIGVNSSELSQEEWEKAEKDYVSGIETTFDNFYKSSDIIDEFLPKDLKERWETCKESYPSLMEWLKEEDEED